MQAKFFQHTILQLSILTLFISCGNNLQGSELETLFETPSSRINLFKSVFVIGDEIEPAKQISNHLKYIDRLTIKTGEETDIQDPKALLAKAAEIIFKTEGFLHIKQAKNAIPVEQLLFEHVLDNKKGPDIALAIVLLAALRNAPYPSEIILNNQEYFILSGPNHNKCFLNVSSGDLIEPKKGKILEFRLQNAPILSNRQLLGHYLLLLGKTARKEKKTDLAHKLLHDAWHLSPQAPELYVELGSLALGKWNLTRAEHCFARAIRLNPTGNMLTANMGLAEVYIRQHRLTEALPVLKKSLDLAPDNFYALLLRGEYFLSQSHPDNRAAQDILKILVERKEDVTVDHRVRTLCGLGLAYLGRKDRVKAAEYIDMAQKLAPDSAEVHYAKAELETDEDRAIVEYGRAIECNERFAPAYLKRGALYEERNLAWAALGDYKSFLKILPLHPLAETLKKRIDELKVDLGNKD